MWGGQWCFFCQAEDGIRDLVRSRGLGDVYKRQLRDIESGRIKEGSLVTCTLTGHGLKDPDTAIKQLSLIHI